MKNTKFIKARCAKTKQAFGIEVKQFGSEWKAVDFVKLTDEQDSKLESQVDVTSLVTAESIQPCAVCGSRTIGKCKCPASHRQNCQKTDPYNYQCIFCKNLSLDYSEASEAREGEKIILSQGQVITLSRRGVEISNLLVGMGWKPSRTSHNMDLDASVVMIEKNGHIKELIYYGRLSDASNSIKHHGDNLTGSVKYGEESDDEQISVDLSKVPSSVQCLAFIVNIYECNSRRQKLGDVEDMHIRLIENRSGKVLAKYTTFAQDQSSTGVIIGAAYRSRGKWAFKAMGDCYKVDNYSSLADISARECKNLL